MTNINDIRDIKPPVEISSGWEWLWWVLAALATIRRRGFDLALVAKAAVANSSCAPVPAHVRAKEMLEKALALIAHPKPFCTLVPTRFAPVSKNGLISRAPERTTEEFLHELRGTNLLSVEQKEKLGEFWGAATW